MVCRELQVFEDRLVLLDAGILKTIMITLYFILWLWVTSAEIVVLVICVPVVLTFVMSLAAMF